MGQVKIKAHERRKIKTIVFIDFMEQNIYVNNKKLSYELKAQNIDLFNQKDTRTSFNNIFYIATKVGYIAKYNSLIYKKTKEFDRDELFQLLMEPVKRS